MQVITSKDNEFIKHIKKLKDKKYRDISKEFIIEGIKLIKEAIEENKKILDEVKKITHKDMMTILKEIDQEFLYQTINREQFKKYFFENAEDGEIKEYIAKILK